MIDDYDGLMTNCRKGFRIRRKKVLLTKAMCRWFLHSSNGAAAVHFFLISRIGVGVKMVELSLSLRS